MYDFMTAYAFTTHIITYICTLLYIIVLYDIYMYIYKLSMQLYMYISTYIHMKKIIIIKKK